MDILDFLHAAIIHILDEIKHSYKPEEHNVAYLTLHQEPLISGLTTVKYIKFNSQLSMNFKQKMFFRNI